MNIQDTIAAIATPAGPGGVAIVRVSGSRAAAIVRQLTGLKNLEPNTIKPCVFYNAEQTAVLDRGLLAFFAAPHSYTGEDVAEFNCHGAYFLAQKILEQAFRAGARLAAPGEFTKRAFLAGKLDLTQVESIADMLNAGSDLALDLARRHLDGDVSRSVRELRKDFLGLLAELEAALDYPEEIADPAREKISALFTAAQARIARLLQDSGRGLLIKSGVNIVLCGRPNTGKSSLFNALLRHNKAIVTEIPGTTRDALEAEASLGGLKITLVDTAGLRDTDEQIERLGIERARAHMRSADLILYLLDTDTGCTAEDQKILAGLPDKKRLVIINKADLPSELEYPGALKVSALRSLGLDRLEQKILELLGLQNIDMNKNIYISSLRQKEKLWQAEKSLVKALDALKTVGHLDILAVFLKEIIVSLGEITGEETSAEIIDEIFANFCVGK